MGKILDTDIRRVEMWMKVKITPKMDGDVTKEKKEKVMVSVYTGIEVTANIKNSVDSHMRNLHIVFSKKIAEENKHADISMRI